MRRGRTSSFDGARLAPLVLALWFCAGATQAEQGGMLGATLNVTSDYVYRGISQTQGQPALQAGAEYRHSSGLWMSAWGSNVDFVAAGQRDDGARIEVDLALGYTHEFSDRWSADLSLTRYSYPGTLDGVDYDYAELALQVYYANVSALIGYAEHVFGENSAGVAYQLTGELLLPWDIRAMAVLGYYDLNDAYQDSYRYYQLGLARSLGLLTLAVNYHDTSASAVGLFGDGIASGRVVLSLSADF